MTEQAVDKGIPMETCIHDLKKMLIYSIIKKGGKMYITEEINIKKLIYQKSNPGTLSSETYVFTHYVTLIIFLTGKISHLYTISRIWHIFRRLSHCHQSLLNH